jgi:hypothetical protein
MIQYSRDIDNQPRSRGVLDTPLEPVIGLAEGETRWRGMTTEDVALCAFSFCQNLNRLIVLADFGVGAQHRIHRLEHVAHALFGNGALDHDHQFRLVGGRPH